MKCEKGCWIPIVKLDNRLHVWFDGVLLCPQLWKCWRGILLSGCPRVRDSVRPSRILMHAVSYEPCMLGFSNFIYGFLMDQKLTDIFFFSSSSSPSYVRFWSYAPLKIRLKSCQQDILKLFDLGTWNLVNWYGMMSRLPVYRLNRFVKCFRSYGPLQIWTF